MKTGFAKRTFHVMPKFLGEVNETDVPKSSVTHSRGSR